MFGLMLQKMWHKKWMNLCLLLGITLLVGTLVSFPLYAQAAYDRMLQDEFDDCLSEQGIWPSMNTLVTFSKKDKKGETIKNMEAFLAGLNDAMGVKGLQTISYYSLTASEIVSHMIRPDLRGEPCPGLRIILQSDTGRISHRRA